MIHKIKIWEEYANAVADGRKNFEIRENDREYQTGDIIEFNVVGGFGHNFERVEHPLYGKRYKITYLLSAPGLKEGWCVFGIEKIKKVEEQQLINGLKDLNEYLKKNEASEGETFYKDKDGDGFKADMGYMESGFKEIWLWLERRLKRKEESK